MIKRDQLTDFIYSTLGADLLEKVATFDTVPNSVQIKGADEVHKIAFGVSASPEFIERCVDEEIDYAVVHHGLHTGYIVNGRFDAYEHRLSLIFKNDITLAGFHASLDIHPDIGNNAIIAEKIGAKRTDESYFGGWGWVAEFDKPVEIEKLADTCSKVFSHDIFAVYAGPQKIKRVGICSGGAVPRSNDLFEMLDKNIDLHITGEIRESSPYMAEEGGYNYFAAGHYATEVFGVQALADKVKKKFKDNLEVEFLDIPNIL